MKSIEISVDKKGNLKLDFIGFVDESCFEESDKLKRALAGLGLELAEGGVIRRKSPMEIADELTNSSSNDTEGLTI